MSEVAVRVDNGWWCEEHQEMHVGLIESWSMEHRRSLHPVFVHWRTHVSAVPRRGSVVPIGPVSERPVVGLNRLPAPPAHVRGGDDPAPRVHQLPDPVEPESTQPLPEPSHRRQTPSSA